MPIEPPSSRRSSERRSVAGALLLVLGLRFGSADAAESASAPLPQFEMTGNTLAFNGHALRFEDRFETWTRALGPPSTTQGSRHRWYGAGLEVWVDTTADGRSYVKTLLLRLGDGGFPGVFVLQGVSIRHGSPTFKVVQAALKHTGTPLWGLGRDRLPESGKLKASGPDGFEVTVAARLDCPKPPPRGSQEVCEQTIGELEIGSAW